MRAFEVFCRKYERYGIKNLMLIIVILNALVYVLYEAQRGGLMGDSGGMSIITLFVFHWGSILQGEVWRLVTFMILPPSDNIFFLIIILYFYYFIGRMLEAQWGALKFTIFFFSGMILTAIASAVTGIPCSAGFVTMGIFIAFAAMDPEYKILFFMIIPMKVKWLALLDFAYILANFYFYGFPGFLVPLAALANVVLFTYKDLPKLFAFPGLRAAGGGRGRTGRNTVSFGDSIKKSRQEKGYIHKCAVCGVTDAERPDMEFRYCSLCQGYCCYCSEHIFDHEHKT